MLIIRLQRVGRRNHAEFRIVLTEHTKSAKSGSFIEKLGHYNPHTNAVSVQKESVLEWIKKGAQVSDTVHNLLVREGVIDAKKKNVLPKKSPPAPKTDGEDKKEATAKEEAAPSDEAADTAEAAAEDTKDESEAKEEDKAKEESEPAAS